MKLDLKNPSSSSDVRITIYYQCIREELKKPRVETRKEKFLLKLKKLLLKLVIKLDSTLVISEGDRVRLQIKQQIERIDETVAKLKSELTLPLGGELETEKLNEIAWSEARKVELLKFLKD